MAEPGEDVIIALRNAGTAAHVLEIEINGERHALARAVAPGETGELRLQMPPEPGEYVFHCPCAEHRAAVAPDCSRVKRPYAVRLEPVASGMVSPIAMAAAPAEDGRRFIVDQIRRDPRADRG